MQRFSILSGLAALVAFGLIVGCKSGEDKSKLMARKWKFSNIESPILDVLPEDEKKKRKEELYSQTTEFTADGTMKGPKDEDGKWSISGNLLITKDMGATKEDTATILELTDSKCVLETEIAGSKTKMTLEPAK